MHDPRWISFADQAGSCGAIAVMPMKRSGVPAAGRGQLIVGVGGQVPGFVGRKHMSAGRGEGDDGLVDAGRVHVGEAARSQILQALEDWWWRAPKGTRNKIPTG